MSKPFSAHFVDYDPDWPHQAQERIARLRVLEPVLVEAHHIGSTSVPGMIAKPIIDLTGHRSQCAGSGGCGRR